MTCNEVAPMPWVSTRCSGKQKELEHPGDLGHNPLPALPPPVTLGPRFNLSFFPHTVV